MDYPSACFSVNQLELIISDLRVRLAAGSQGESRRILGLLRSTLGCGADGLEARAFELYGVERFRVSDFLPFLPAGLEAMASVDADVYPNALIGYIDDVHGDLEGLGVATLVESAVTECLFELQGECLSDISRIEAATQRIVTALMALARTHYLRFAVENWVARAIDDPNLCSSVCVILLGIALEEPTSGLDYDLRGERMAQPLRERLVRSVLDLSVKALVDGRNNGKISASFCDEIQHRLRDVDDAVRDCTPERNTVPPSGAELDRYLRETNKRATRSEDISS